MKLPLAWKRQTCFPRRPVCPVCRKAKVFEPHSFAVLSAGALLMDRRSRTGAPSDKLDGFFHLYWHGAHDGGEGQNREISLGLPIADDARGGQFEVYVCSTRCLRKLLASFVDELEEAMRRARPLSAPRPRRRPKRAP